MAEDSSGGISGVAICCASCHSHDLEGGGESYFQSAARTKWILCFLCARCRHTMEDSPEGALTILESLAIEFHSDPDEGGLYTLSRPQ